MVDAIGDRLWV